MTSMVPEQAWTTQPVRCFGAICACHYAEQLAATCEGVFPPSVGEETEVPDADQPFGQNVKKKSAQELICDGPCGSFGQTISQGSPIVFRLPHIFVQKGGIG